MAARELSAAQIQALADRVIHYNDDSYYSDKGFMTRSIHVGQKPDPVTGAVMMPITLSSTFAQTSPGEMFPSGYDYSRGGNPTRDALEKVIASLENGKHGLCFSSGLAATMAVVQTFAAGLHILCSDDVYGGTNRLFRRIGSVVGNVRTTFVDMTQLPLVEAALAANPDVKLVWIETPTNPTLKVCDVAAVAALAHKAGCTVVADNTFATPYFQRPLELGADIVLHSATKYMGGHSDVVQGMLIVGDNDELAKKLRFIQFAGGAIPSPFDCYMTLRSLKTLGLRMEAHQANAFAVARALEGHPKVEKVLYPGLPSHPQHETAKKQMSGFSGMVTIVLRGDLEVSRTFLQNVHVFTLGESLGGVESLIEHPAIMTHASVPPEQRKELGINDGLVRLSCGVETAADLVADVLQALDKCQL